ncbi:MAG: hypothetical protein EXX96DRAFT_472463 [Benjaminiella poitrasii]|nr:MAG: hypothetical protein EXX96DRAFT_472463 [Benjaminiella poitrasii]
MTTSHQLNGFNYEDYIPTESILCPICEINCDTLENLNKHLDIAHSEEDSKGALLSWLRNAQKKVQTSLTSSNANNKLGPYPPANNSSIKQWVDPSLINRALSLSNTTNPNFFVSDIDKQDDFVTRDHWQRETGYDKCNIPGCDKIVGKSGAGKQHCRRYQSLLSPSSNSLNSFSLDRSSTSSRDSLGSMLSPKSSFVSNNNSILSMKLKYRDGEQSVIKWEDDRTVKVCPCCGYVFRRKLRNEEASKPLPIIQLYNQLSITKNNIEKQLPKFHQSILMLEKENITSHTHESFVKAAQIRKLLLENFVLYDTLAKSIKTLPVQTPSLKRLQSNICYAANLYLQQNMLPLQMLPRILKSANSNSANKKKDHKRELIEEQLQTYLEQYHLIEGYIKEANADRKYDDVKTLKSSLEELHSEISRLRTILG